MEPESSKEKEKFSLREWIENHPKAVFAIRMFFWVLFAAVLPFVFIAWRYDIFTNESKLRLTGWGFIAIVIVAVFLISLVKYIYKGLKPGLLKQCIGGFASIILPLTLLLLLVTSVQDNVAVFKQSLGCVILCEAIGIPFNPLPAWVESKKKERDDAKFDNLSEMLWQKFFDKKGKGE